MKHLLTSLLLLLCLALRCQDKIYLLDGSSRTGRVTEITSERITMDAQETEVIAREKVLLIEFKNGEVELMNRPAQDLVYNANSHAVRENNVTAKKDRIAYNLVSVNTLALCNADISVFYEKILPHRKIGLGVMGAYNFNQYVNGQDAFIAVLANAKKKYDLGIFANGYAGDLQSGTSFHYGILFKYLSFNFSKVTEESSVSGGLVTKTISYSPATGSQLATIITFGTYTRLGKSFFIKSLFGIGGFNLRGDYKQQYNYYLNGSNNRRQNGNTNDRTFLPKLYLGINAGFNF